MKGMTGLAGTVSFPLEMEILSPAGGVQVVNAMIVRLEKERGLKQSPPDWSSYLLNDLCAAATVRGADLQVGSPPSSGHPPERPSAEEAIGDPTYPRSGHS